MLLVLFSIGMTQFCIDVFATAERKASDVHIIVETDLWSSIVIVLTDDIPFLAMRLYVMTNYQVSSLNSLHALGESFRSGNHE